MNWYEIVGVVFGLVCVWMTTKQNIWCWPIGIVSVLSFIVVFYQANLFPDMFLHVIYFWLSIYGWMKWRFGMTKWTQSYGKLPIINVKKMELISWLILIPLTSMSIGWIFDTHTQSSAPYIDSFIFVVSLVAQYLMARKILQSWYFWVVVDIVAIGLYESRGLHLTSVLYLVYLFLCIRGYFQWKDSKEV